MPGKTKPTNSLVTPQTPLEFYDDLMSHLKQAKEKIWLQSMIFDPGEYTDAAAEVMRKKPGEGLDVRVTVDWISEQYYQSRFDYLPNPNIKWQLEKRAFRKKRKALLDWLHEGGVKITFTNIPNYLMSLLPQVGRNHTKIYLVDDTAWMGGINFMPSSFRTYDGMVKTTNKTFVAALRQHYCEVNEQRPQTSYAVQLAEKYRLLVDNGQRSSSLIYDEAIENTLAAKKEIIFISQIVPSGRFLDALIKQAEKRIPVTFVTSSHADEMYSAFFPRLLYKHFLTKIKHVPAFKIYHVDRKVHLKLLMLDNQEVFFGSHNLSELGVQLGTEEIMLHAEDERLVEEFKGLANSFNLLPK